MCLFSFLLLLQTKSPTLKVWLWIEREKFNSEYKPRTNENLRMCANPRQQQKKYSFALTAFWTKKVSPIAKNGKVKRMVYIISNFVLNLYKRTKISSSIFCRLSGEADPRERVLCWEKKTHTTSTMLESTF